MSSVLRVERHGTTARVTLTRPEVRNAFDAELIAELRATFEALSAEPPSTLRAVVLAGEGRTFCAGADVEWMRSAIGLSVEENERDAAAMQAMFTAIDRCSVPVIAIVQGAALGGGMGLCAVSDLVVAAADAKFGFTETRLGIIPAVIGPFVLPKIGASHARALFTSGQRFDADRALRIGLVHEVVADAAALEPRATELLEELEGAAPQATREAKSLVELLVHADPADARLETVRRIARLRTADEGQEGLRAFVDKRAPRWRA